MKAKWNQILMGAAVLFAVAAMAAPPATILNPVTPGTISYQGRLQTANGVNYTNGVYDIQFRVYDEESGGNLKWAAQYSPYVLNGYFSVILGATGVGEEPLTESQTYPNVDDFWKGIWIDPANTDPAAANRYLEMEVLQDEKNDIINTETQPSFPRQRFLASPFAIQAQFAQSAHKATTSTDATYASNSRNDFNVGRALSVTDGNVWSEIAELRITDNDNDADLWVDGTAKINKLTLTAVANDKPFYAKTATINGHGNGSALAFSVRSGYTPMVVGFNAGGTGTGNCYAYRSGSSWLLKFQHSSYVNWDVQILFIRNDFCDDQR